ncbi:MAG: haloacid dehalogenase, partial [Fimbriimonadaceae bacterium]
AETHWLSSWESIVRDLRASAERMHEAREIGLAKCRTLIQTSAKCIRHVHRHQFEEAKRLLEDAKRIASEARTALTPFPSVMHAGFLHDAEKEMVEAACVLSMVQGRPLPDPQELGAMAMSYLNGVGEAASECRRFALDEMRRGHLDAAERLLGAMEAVYDELITFDFPDSMTGGLRRTCDALRAVVERTRSDLTATASQQELIRELRETRRSLSEAE